MELAVHGLDLAAGLHREPWTTPSAATLVECLLLGDGSSDAGAAMGWDRLRFIRKATGREPLSEPRPVWGSSRDCAG